MQISTERGNGTASVTNGINIVYAQAGVDWSQAHQGSWFTVVASMVPYTIAAPPVLVGDTWHILLSGNYAGPTNAAAAYVIHIDFGPNNEPIYNFGDTEFYTIQNRWDQILAASAIGDASPTAKGRTFLSRAAAIATSPIAVGDNDPRVAQRFVVGTDNAAADTASLQAAIDGLGTAGGVIRTAGIVSITSASISFPSLTNSSIVFEVYGAWRLAVSLVLPDNVFWIGIGGAPNLQFQRAAQCAKIIPHGDTTPTIIVRGSNAHLLKNLQITGNKGPGILYDGASSLGALAQMENVGILAADLSTACCLVLDAFFWFWARNCSFLAPANNPYAIRLTTSNASHSSTGIVHIEDSVIAVRAIQMDAQVNVNQQGNLLLRNIIYENALSPLLNLDATRGVISGIELDHVEIADAVSMPCVINIVAGQVRNVSIKNSDHMIQPGSPLVLGGSIAGLHVESGRAFEYDTGWNMGAVQKKFAFFANGVVDAGWAGAGADMAPAVVPVASAAVNQDASTWGAASGSAIVATGVLAPDGSATAATLSSAAGELDREVYRQSAPLAAGDWLIGGVWMKSSNGGLVSKPIIATNAGTPAQLDTGTTFFRLTNDVSQRIGAPWTPVIGASKVVSAPGTPYELIYQLKCDATHPTSYWKPFLMRIPAGTMADEEVIRLIRYLSGNVVSGLPAGSIAMHSHQSFYAGRIISQILTTFANGATTPSVAAGNDFKTANAAPTSITDFTSGVNGQEIVVLVDANTTIVHGSTIKARSGANIVGAANVTHRFKRLAGVWYQTN